MMTPDDTVANDGTDAVALDANCRRCGYNLRGLSESGRCPECGDDVRASLRGDLLWFCEPAWLRRVRAGLRVVLAGIAAIVLAQVIVILALMLLPSPRLFTFLPLGDVIARATFFGGIAWFNAPDPGGIGEREQRGLRAAMWAGVIGGGADIAWTLFRMIGPRMPLMSSLTWVLGSLTPAAGVVGFCALLLAVSRLARRLPDGALASRGRTLAKVMGAALGGIVIISFVARFLVAHRPLMTTLAAASIACLLVVFVGGLFCVGLLWTTQRRIGAAASAVEAVQAGART